MNKKQFRVFYLIPASIAATMLFWLYRYMWFSIETVPADRVFAALMGLMLSGLLFMNEVIDRWFLTDTSGDDDGDAGLF